MHTHHRTRTAALTLTTAALLATLSCTPPAEAGSQSPTPTPTQAAPSTSSPVPRPGEAEGEPTGKNGNCSDEYAQVSVEWAVPPSKDDSKLMLTVDNKGPTSCLLTSYPVLRIKDGFGPLIAVMESTKPQAPVLLEPGKSAYAGLLARQGGKQSATLTTDLALAPHGQPPEENTGEGTLLQLPPGGVHMTPKAQVTYWQPTSESAASPLFTH
ncbi:DUF4232 domain-containing protein [Streptomyces sp. NPDC047014]|uniref:DUF4232 domain-containing protein n=1 Tax=Streptomyces sp. NPDC047014 TaxID=3155736 RepID=UPI0033E47416